MSSEAIRSALSAAAGLSSTAKLVALCEAFGITDREDLESLLEAKPSTLREAKRALKIQRQKSSDAGNPAPEIQRGAGNPAETPEIQRQKSSDPSRAHATKELPSEVVMSKGEIPPLVPQSEKNGDMPAHVKPITDWSKAHNADLPDCEILNGRIVLRGAMRAEALEDFDGDERRLAKALDQAGGYVQANSSRPLAAQVRSQLGRIVGQRIDNDKRSSKPTAGASGKPTVAEVMARMAAKHQAEAAA